MCRPCFHQLTSTRLTQGELGHLQAVDPGLLDGGSEGVEHCGEESRPAGPAGRRKGCSLHRWAPTREIQSRGLPVGFSSRTAKMGRLGQRTELAAPPLRPTDLSCFPGSCNCTRQQSAARISSSFFRISLCKPDIQSWATDGFRF